MALPNYFKEFALTIDRHRRQGFGWRYDGLESWTTEAIFEKLRELHVDTDAGRFVEQATAAGRIKVLDADWDKQLVAGNDDPGFWRDFPLIAIPVLWKRLADHLVCPETIDDRITEAADAEEEGRPLPDVDGLPATVGAALVLARYLAAFPVEERRVQFDELNRIGLNDYMALLFKLIESKGADYPDEMIQIVDVIAELDTTNQLQSELTFALAIAGRREEAIHRAAANIQRYPEDIWVKIRAGDVYEELGDDADAINVWVAALAMARDPQDWDDVEDRLVHAFEGDESGEELGDIFLTYPRPGRWKRRVADYEPPPVVEPERLVRAKICGRNEPCPCGSGKKYKKCCMG